MQLLNIVALLITVTAVFSYLNHRLLRLPTTIGIMLIALVFSLLLNLLGPLGMEIEHEVELMLASIEFDDTLLHGIAQRKFEVGLVFAGGVGFEETTRSSQPLTEHSRCNQIVGLDR